MPRAILAKEGRDPLVTMEVFAREDAVLCGIDEARNLLGHVLAGADPAETRLEALSDGDTIAPKEVVLRIRARYRRFGLYETAFLGMLAQSTGWATAARTCVEVAAPDPVISFGARHIHPDITDVLDYAAIVGGCVGASTPAGARLAGLAPTGTMPHSLVLIFGDTVEAALAFDRHVPPDVPRIVLVDTFKDEAEEALRVAHALGDRLYGVRLDTPSERGRVTADLVHEVRARLDQAGFHHVKITVSGGLTPGADRVLQGRRRAGRLVRRRLVHQRRDADRLHRRHQGDRRPADRQARPHPGPDRFAAAQAGGPRALPRGIAGRGRRRWRARALAASRAPCHHRGMQSRGPRKAPTPTSARPPTSCSSAARQLLDRRHIAQAAIVLERADRLEPGKGSILEALGRAYFNSGQAERRARRSRRCSRSIPSSHFGHFALGQSLKRLGRRREAGTHLRLAVALSPNTTLYRDALARLGSTLPAGAGLRRRPRSRASQSRPTIVLPSRNSPRSAAATASRQGIRSSEQVLVLVGLSAARRRPARRSVARYRCMSSEANPGAV